MPRQIVVNGNPPVKKIKEMKLKLVNSNGNLIYISKKKKIFFVKSCMQKNQYVNRYYLETGTSRYNKF